MKPALILIDIQNDYFPGGKMELEGSPEASLQAAQLLERFRARGCRWCISSTSPTGPARPSSCPAPRA